RLDDDLAAEARDLVHLLDHRDTFDEIAESDYAADFREDRLGKLIPFGHRSARLNSITFLHLQDCSVEKPMMRALATCVVDHDDLTVPVHDDGLTILASHQVGTANADRAFMTQLELVRLDLASSGRTTDVERTHRELSSRLTNRLSCDDTNGFTDID